jgi:hypothetical protein
MALHTTYVALGGNIIWSRLIDWTVADEVTFGPAVVADLCLEGLAGRGAVASEVVSLAAIVARTDLFGAVSRKVACATTIVAVHHE